MTRLLFLIMFLSSFQLFGQNKKYIVRLDPITEKVEGLDFTCARVIDKRINTEDIGYVQKGLSNRKVVAKLDEEFSLFMEKTLRKLCPRGEEIPELVFIFHEMEVSERTTNSSEKGICRIQLEVAREVDTTLMSLGVFESTIVQGGLDVTNAHGRRILKGLKDCLMSIGETDWKNEKGVLIEANTEPFTFDYKLIPPAGLYSSFGQLARHEPFMTEGYEISTGNYPRYKILENGKRSKKRILFFSDGADVFIHASRYHYGDYFIKSKHLGKIIYFEDRFSDQGATIAFGLIGAAASNKRVGIVFNTETGETNILNNHNFYQLIKSYPEFVSEYRKSKRKREDRERILLLLNEKLE